MNNHLLVPIILNKQDKKRKTITTLSLLYLTNRTKKDKQSPPCPAPPGLLSGSCLAGPGITNREIFYYQGMWKYLQRFILRIALVLRSLAWVCAKIWIELFYNQVTCLGVCCSELQLGPHGVHVGLAQHDQSSSTGLNGLNDLVWNHLADLIDNMIRNVEICWCYLRKHQPSSLLCECSSDTAFPLLPLKGSPSQLPAPSFGED